MNKYKLYYDSSCPICTSFVSMIKSKLSTTEISYIPITTNNENFKLETPHGKTLEGQAALDELTKNFPKILSYFWMLPNKFKKPALNAVYKVGSAIRKTLKGCGCSKKK